jgi:hypothetical protein
MTRMFALTVPLLFAGSVLFAQSGATTNHLYIYVPCAVGASIQVRLFDASGRYLARKMLRQEPDSILKLDVPAIDPSTRFVATSVSEGCVGGTIRPRESDGLNVGYFDMSCSSGSAMTIDVDSEPSGAEFVVRRIVRNAGPANECTETERETEAPFSLPAVARDESVTIEVALLSNRAFRYTIPINVRRLAVAKTTTYGENELARLGHPTYAGQTGGGASPNQIDLPGPRLRKVTITAAEFR